MYEKQLPTEWLEQPVGDALGMSMHESQSLLVEMQACRSHAFMQFMANKAMHYFGDVTGLTAENLYRHYTQVKPGYIRVDADELTYPLHVILRYEIEKALISGECEVEDLPEMWNEKMTGYLGLSIKDDYKDGVMQDVHWPSGAFGYFPAYTLGALIAAQLFQTALTNHNDIFERIGHGDFSLLMDWLKTHVHSKASAHHFNDILLQATGEELSSKFYIEHIRRRYLDQ